MKAVVFLSLVGGAAGMDGIKGNLVRQLASQVCALEGALSADDAAQWNDSQSGGHLQDGDTCWAGSSGCSGGTSSCSETYSVSESINARCTREIGAKATQIADSQKDVSDLGDTIVSEQGKITGAQIKYDVQEVRKTAETKNLANWIRVKDAETKDHNAAVASLDDHIGEIDDFLLELNALLVASCSDGTCLSDILSESNGGGSVFLADITNEMEVLKASNTQEKEHMTGEKNRLVSAWAVREAALQALICTARDNLDNSDNAGDNVAVCSQAGDDTSAVAEMAAAQSALDTAKAALQTAQREETAAKQLLAAQQAAREVIEANCAAEKKTYSERISAYVTVIAQASSMGFIQLDQQVNHPVFVQLSSEFQSRDPISKVQQSLLATAESEGNKKLAMFATSLTQVMAQTGGAGDAIQKVIVLIKDMIVDLQKAVDENNVGSWCQNQEPPARAAVNNALRYLRGLQIDADEYNAAIARDNAKISSSNTEIADKTEDLQEEEEELVQATKTYENARATAIANAADANTLLSGLSDAPQDGGMQLMGTILGDLASSYQAEVQSLDAAHKSAVSAFNEVIAPLKILIAQVTADHAFATQMVNKNKGAFEQTMLALGEAQETWDAAKETLAQLQQTCSSENGAKEGNGASAKEKCVQTCHTVVALEAALGVDGVGAGDSEQYQCFGENVVHLSVSAEGVADYACAASAPGGATACTGVPAAGSECYFTLPGANVRYSDIACFEQLNGECQVAQESVGGVDGCDPDTGVMSGEDGVMLGECRPTDD